LDSLVKAGKKPIRELHVLNDVFITVRVTRASKIKKKLLSRWDI